jgi:hypothetical protein
LASYVTTTFVKLTDKRIYFFVFYGVISDPMAYKETEERQAESFHGLNEYFVDPYVRL